MELFAHLGSIVSHDSSSAGYVKDGDVPMRNADSFSSALKVALEKASLDADSLAQFLGVKGTTVSRWIAGKTIPSDSIVRRIATVLDMRGELLGQEFLTAAGHEPIANAELSALTLVDRIERWLPWIIFAMIATALGFAMDAFDLWELLRNTDAAAWLTTILATLMLAWLASSVIVATEKPQYQPWRSRSRQELTTARVRRYPEWLYRISLYVSILLPTLIVVGFWSYRLWADAPPTKIAVIVTKFPAADTNQDPNGFTERFVDKLKDGLVQYPNIEVKTVGQPITDDDAGNDTARSLAQRPWHKAAIVIWGHYVVEPEPEVYLHFSMTRNRSPLLDANQEWEYGPELVPDMFTFKQQLGQDMAALVAFTVGISLHQAGLFKDAAPYFETASGAIDSQLTPEFKAPILYYWGDNDFSLGDLRRAVEHLELLVANQQTAKDNPSLWLTGLTTLGNVYGRLGETGKAIEVLDKGLQIAQDNNVAAIEMYILNSLGNIHRDMSHISRTIEYLSQALEIAKQQKDSPNEAAILAGLGSAYRKQGDSLRSVDYFEQAMAILNRSKRGAADAALLVKLGITYELVGRTEEAIRLYEEGLSIARTTGEREVETASLTNLAYVFAKQRQYTKALEYGQDALILTRESGDRADEAMALNLLGGVYRALGQNASAQTNLDQALEISRSIGNREGESTVLMTLGSFSSEVGNTEQAISYTEQSLQIAREIGNRSLEVSALVNLGSYLASKGEIERAIEMNNQALAIARQSNDADGEAAALSNLGMDYHAKGLSKEGLEFSSKSFEIIQKTGNLEFVSCSLGNMARSYLQLGQTDKAIDAYKELLSVSERTGDQENVADAKASLGNIYRELGRYEDAETLLQEALVLTRQLGDRRNEASVLNNLGATHNSLGRVDQAISEFDKARTIANGSGSPDVEGAVMNNLGTAYEKQGRHNEAIASFERAVSIYDWLSTSDSLAGMFDQGEMRINLEQSKQNLEDAKLALDKIAH